MFCPYQETVDSFEQQWAVNYLSHFLLTAELLPLLKAGGLPEQCSRIVNITSCAHLIGKINFNDINSKYYIILFLHSYFSFAIYIFIHENFMLQIETNSSLNMHMHKVN